MNKQEVLKKLEQKKETILRSQKNLLMESELWGLYEARATTFMSAINIVEQLDEPQKVKVPKCVGELLDYYRNSTDVDLLALLITFKNWYCRKDKAGENENAIDWLVKHPEKYMRAWLDGYEVEEEPKWVGKVGNLYFCGWEDTTAQFVMNTVLGEDESIIKYKNEGTASSVAKNLGGTVEKV